MKATYAHRVVIYCGDRTHLAFVKSPIRVLVWIRFRPSRLRSRPSFRVIKPNTGLRFAVVEGVAVFFKINKKKRYVIEGYIAAKFYRICRFH